MSLFTYFSADERRERRIRKLGEEIARLEGEVFAIRRSTSVGINEEGLLALAKHRLQREIAGRQGAFVRGR